MLAQFMGAVNTSLLPTVTFCIKLLEREATEPDLPPALSLEMGAVGAIAADFAGVSVAAGGHVVIDLVQEALVHLLLGYLVAGAVHLTLWIF